MNLRQVKKRVADYVIEFRTLSTDSGWNSSTLVDAFVQDLSPAVKGQLISVHLPDDALTAPTVKIDKRLMEHKSERSSWRTKLRVYFYFLLWQPQSLPHFMCVKSHW